MNKPVPPYYLFCSRRGEVQGYRRQPTEDAWENLKRPERLGLVWKNLYSIFGTKWREKLVTGNIGIYMEASLTSLGKHILNFWDKTFSGKLYALSIILLISNPLFAELFKRPIDSTRGKEILHLHWHILVLIGYMLGRNKLLSCNKDFCCLKHQKLFNTNVKNFLFKFYIY